MIVLHIAYSIMEKVSKDLDVTGTLSYLEGNVGFLLEAKDRHSETANEAIQETKDMLRALRMKLYGKHHHFLSV